MRALVLGGNGFIGSHLVDRLLAEGHTVRVFDKYKEYFRRPIKEVEYCYGDFGNRGLVSDALADIDLVFHLISTTLPKTSNEDPAFDVHSNVVESIFLLEKCVSCRVKKIVFISSGGTIYGEPITVPVKEDAPKNPVCSYGITKLSIEKYLFLFNHLYGLNCAIVRPSNPYGPRQNPEHIQGAISVFLGKIKNGEPIEIWGDGEVIRDYIYIDDLVDGIYRAGLLKAPYGIFNIGSGAGYSLNEILKIIYKIVGCEKKIIYQKKRSLDVPKIWLDISGAREVLYWEPVTKLDDGIKITWDFIEGLGT
jgi:UDP-glucose 4-epimerase